MTVQNLCDHSGYSRDHSKCRCLNNVRALSQSKNEKLYKTGSARGDVRFRRMSANNLLPLENASGLLKTPLPRDVQQSFNQPKNVWYFKFTYPSVRQFLSVILPSTIIPEKMYSVLSRVPAKRTPNQLDPLFSVRVVITHFYVLAHFGIVAWFCCQACL